MGIREESLAFEAVEGDVLTIRYVPLSAFDLEVALWKRNLKRHDVQMLTESIEEYGYADCAKWDSTINGGEGGFIYGNGRTKSLILLLFHLYEQGAEPPRGIGKRRDTGEWVIPVKFGVDAESEAQAEAFGLDHNLLTMQGGDFSAADIAKMFDGGLIDQLQEMSAGGSMPIGFDNDYLSSLIRYEELSGGDEGGLEFQSPDYSDDEEEEEEEDLEPEEDDLAESKPRSQKGEDEDEFDAPPTSSVRMLNLFLDTDTHPEMMRMIEVLNSTHGTANPTDCILAVMRVAARAALEAE